MSDREVKKYKKPLLLILLILFGFFISLMSPILSNDSIVYANDSKECKTPEVDDKGNLKDPNLDNETSIECFSTGRAGCNVYHMGFFVCATTFIVSKLVDGAFYVVRPLLRIQPISRDTEGGKYLYDLWSNFRNIANVIFVLMLLAVVYSQITGGGLTNYTIKRALPRLIVNIILVNLSYYICLALIDIFNILGSSLRDVMDIISDVTKFNLEFDLASKIGYTFLGAIASASLAVLSIFVAGFIVPFFTMGIVLLFTVILILGLRYALLIIMVIISPIAFALNVFPNTQKWFSRWWKTFITAGILYPIIAFLAGSGALLSNIIKAGGGGSGSLGDFIFSILGIAAQIMPLVLIPKAIKYASGAMGAIAGAASKFTDKTTGKATSRINDKARFLQKRANLNAEDINNKKGRFIRGRVLRRISASKGKDEEAKNQAQGSNYGQGRGPTAHDSFLAENSEFIGKAATFGDVDAGSGSAQQVSNQVNALDPGGSEYSDNNNEENANDSPFMDPNNAQSGSIREDIVLAGVEVEQLEIENLKKGISAEQTRQEIIQNADGKYDQSTVAAALKRQLENSNFQEILDILNNHEGTAYNREAIASALSEIGGPMFGPDVVNKARNGDLYNGDVSSHLAESFAKNASPKDVGNSTTKQLEMLEKEVRKLESQNTADATKMADDIKQKIQDAYQDDEIRAKLSSSSREAARRINPNIKH